MDELTARHAAETAAAADELRMMLKQAEARHADERARGRVTWAAMRAELTVDAVARERAARGRAGCRRRGCRLRLAMLTEQAVRATELPGTLNFLKELSN